MVSSYASSIFLNFRTYLPKKDKWVSIIAPNQPSELAKRWKNGRGTAAGYGTGS